jgi:hypothetical protein
MEVCCSAGCTAKRARAHTLACTTLVTRPHTPSDAIAVHTLQQSMAHFCCSAPRHHHCRLLSKEQERGDDVQRASSTLGTHIESRTQKAKRSQRAAAVTAIGVVATNHHTASSVAIAKV